VSVFFILRFSLLKRSNVNVHMQWQRMRKRRKKSHRDSTHIATATGHCESRGYHRRNVCMGKTIFMGTIRLNCFNLIGNFSSFCWLVSQTFFSVLHLIDKQREWR
jgi:hypothetical protein